MARIRTLKPEFWADEKLSLLDPLTRLVFLGLLSLADDAGRLLDNVKLLDGQLFPNTDDTCRGSLDTLARLSRVIRYTSASGQNLIQIANWERHQKVDKPSKYCLPAPTAEQLAGQWVPEPSRESRENVASESRESRAPTLDLGPRTKDHRPRTEGAPSRVATDDARAADVRAVLEHYQARHPRSRPFTDANRRVVRARLRDGYSVRDLCDAIAGNASDPFCVRECKTDLEYALRSSKVDGHIARAAQDDTPAVGPDGTITAEARQALGMAS